MKESRFLPDQHKEFFAEFCHNIRILNATTPHLKMVVESAKDLPFEQRLWRGGCYAFVYNYPSAEILWKNLPSYDYVLSQGYDWLFNWLKENWKGLPLRRERKAVNSVKNMTENIMSFSLWASKFDVTNWQADLEEWESENGSPEQYEYCWEDFNTVKFMGRYIAIRFLEYTRLSLDTGVVMPDIRPIGGEYPRQSLSLLYPEYKEALLGGNGKEEIALTNKAATLCKEMLESKGVVVSYYSMQSLLCEYKQAVIGKKQFPGHSLDSELGYMTKTRMFWGDDYETQMFDVRKELFPVEALGELQGWYGKRKEPAAVLFDHEYIWNDMKYDYLETLKKDAFSDPVLR